MIAEDQLQEILDALGAEGNHSLDDLKVTIQRSLQLMQSVAVMQECFKMANTYAAQQV